jgi:hypothetical protein
MAETRTNRVGNDVQSQEASPGMSNPAAVPSKGEVKETATMVGERAQEIVADVGQRARDTASSLTQEARDAVPTAHNKADGAISSVGEGISSLASSVRDKVSPDSALGSAAGIVADQLNAAGSYLQQHGLSDMGKDLTAVIRKYPVPALFVALGIGLLLGRTRR